MHTTPPAGMPPITHDHLQAAFQAMKWPGWTFEQAMANDMRRRLIECRAATLAARERNANTAITRQVVRRVRLNERGEVASWCTQIVMGPRRATEQPDLLDI